MWEIREGEYPKYGRKRSMSEADEAYECGYEDGYRDAMKEAKRYYSDKSSYKHDDER